MSVAAVARAWESKTEGSHRLVLLALATCLPEHATLDELVRLTRLSPLTISRALVALRHSGDLVRVEAS